MAGALAVWGQTRRVDRPDTGIGVGTRLCHRQRSATAALPECRENNGVGRCGVKPGGQTDPTPEPCGRRIGIGVGTGCATGSAAPAALPARREKERQPQEKPRDAPEVSPGWHCHLITLPPDAASCSKY